VSRSRVKATYDDVLRLPEHVVGEIVGGELFVSPRPSLGHAHSAGGVHSQVWGPFNRGPNDPEGPGGWWILFEPELHLREDVLVPDPAGWRRERLPRGPRGPYAEVAPDWVCEVLSPSTRSLDRGRKLSVYAREAAGHVWLLDPIEKTFEIFRLNDDAHYVLRTVYGADDARVRAEPFDAIELDLLRLWLDEA